MSSPQAARTRGAGSIASAVMLAALLVVMLTFAAPATAAAAKVVGGDTQLTIPKAQVLALTAKNVAVLPVPPVSFRFQWEPGLSWWYDLPIASGSTFDYAAKKGVFLHSGMLRFVNVLTEQELLFGGEEFPVEKIVERAPIDGDELGPRTETELISHRPWVDGGHPDHGAHQAAGRRLSWSCDSATRRRRTRP